PASVGKHRLKGRPVRGRSRNLVAVLTDNRPPLAGGEGTQLLKLVLIMLLLRADPGIDGGVHRIPFLRRFRYSSIACRPNNLRRARVAWCNLRSCSCCSRVSWVFSRMVLGGI